MNRFFSPPSAIFYVVASWPSTHAHKLTTENLTKRTEIVGIDINSPVVIVLSTLLYQA